MITVCIPTYNEEKHIGTTLKSVEKNIDYISEVIISDNASTDSTSEICMAFTEKYPEKVTFTEQSSNIGAVENFNYVLQNVKTAWFMWLGGHDRLSDNFAERVSEAISKHSDAGMFYFNTINYIRDRDGDFHAGGIRSEYTQCLESKDAFDRIVGFIEESLDLKKLDMIFYSVYNTELAREAYSYRLSGNSLYGFDNAFLLFVIKASRAVFVPDVFYGATRQHRQQSALANIRRYKRHGIIVKIVNFGKAAAEWQFEIVEDILSSRMTAEELKNMKKLFYRRLSAFDSTTKWLRWYIRLVIYEVYFRIMNAFFRKRLP